jgi:hypothetical protein
MAGISAVGKKFEGLQLQRLAFTPSRPGRMLLSTSSVTRWHPLARFAKEKVFCQPILQVRDVSDGLSVKRMYRT